MRNNLSNQVAVIKKICCYVDSYHILKVIKMGHETIQSSLHSYIEDEGEYAREERDIEIANNMINNGFSLDQ